MLDIVIGGDMCPIGRNEDYFRRGDAAALLDGLLEEFQKADLSIVNLECPLITASSPISKIGPVLGADVSCLRALESAGIDIVGLANNHILDHGSAGLRSTLAACEKAGMETVGAGENLTEARRILIREIKGIRIGILGMAEHEFSIATARSGGANPLDVIDYVRNVSERRSDFDYLIVLLHGGSEHYPYPSPRVRDTCRFLIEQGANAVISQHSHCAGCWESYRHGHIVYGQGNLIFDFPSPRETWNTGFLVKLSVKPGGQSSLSIVPHTQSHGGPGAARLRGQEEAAFLRQIQQRCDDIQKDSFVSSEWFKFCRWQRYSYLGRTLGLGRLMRFLNKKLRLVDYLYSKKSLALVRNTVETEAHREVLLTILRDSDRDVDS